MFITTGWNSVPYLYNFHAVLMWKLPNNVKRTVQLRFFTLMSEFRASKFVKNGTFYFEVKQLLTIFRPIQIAAISQIIFSFSSNPIHEMLIWTTNLLIYSVLNRLLSIWCSEKGEGGHVFISYQWDSQPMVKKLASSLRIAGFQVWLDLDNMGKSGNSFLFWIVLTWNAIFLDGVYITLAR